MLFWCASHRGWAAATGRSANCVMAGAEAGGWMDGREEEREREVWRNCDGGAEGEVERVRMKGSVTGTARVSLSSPAAASANHR